MLVTTWILAAGGALRTSTTARSKFAPASFRSPLPSSFPSAGQRGRRRADRGGRLQLPLRLPRVRPHRRARPRLLPQGGDDDDYMYADGNNNDLQVCPASALPAALDLVFFRRAATATTRALQAASEQWRTASEPPARLTKLEFNQHYNSPRRRRSRSVTWCL